MVLVADRFTLQQQDLDELSEMLAGTRIRAPLIRARCRSALSPGLRPCQSGGSATAASTCCGSASTNFARSSAAAGRLRRHPPVWTAAGGNLCIYGAGDDWRRLREIESILELGDPPAEDDDPLRGWVAPDKSIFGKFLTGIGNEAAAYPVYEGDPNHPALLFPLNPSLTRTIDRLRLRSPLRPSSRRFCAASSTWAWWPSLPPTSPFRATPTSGSGSSIRSGRSGGSGRSATIGHAFPNADFWDFLIPGVRPGAGQRRFAC